jgi:galactokinase
VTAQHIEHFSRLGMSDADAAARAGLMARVEAGFRREAGAAPAWLWFVPGRIEVFGKHTDYAGGRSLLCTVPRGIAVAARPREDGIVRVVDLKGREIVAIDPALDRAPRPGLDNYAGAVARRLALNFPKAPLGAELAILSDLPRAAGVSSSSALVVGIAYALIRRASLHGRPEWRANIASIDDEAWYLGCVENGLSFRALPSSSGVGTLGGSEDHTAILACRAGHVSQYRFVPVHHIGDVVVPRDWTFVVASSGVHADKAGGVRELYNNASRATQVLLEIWNRQAAIQAGSLGEALDSGAGAAALLHDLLDRGSSGGFDAESLRTRLAHFTREDARVPAAARAFATADRSAIGELAADSQLDADMMLDNQVPETRELVRQALNLGAFAASAFGAGFGGSVWALVNAQDAEPFSRDWASAYAAKAPHIAGGECFVARPGPPLTELPVTV